MDNHHADKIVELNTEETEQVVGGRSLTPVGPAGNPNGANPGINPVHAPIGLPSQSIRAFK
jgi:hypothetical protein